MSTPITACGGVLFRVLDTELQVLLIRRRGLWDLPKGKRDGHESIPHAAVREVSEEVGVELPMIVTNLGHTWHSYASEDESYLKSTYWFVMVTREFEFSPQAEEDIDKVEWYPLDIASDIVAFDNLKEVLKRFKAWWKTQRSD